MFSFSNFPRIVDKGRSFFAKRFVSNAVLPFIALVLLWGFFLLNAFKGDRSFALWMDNEFFLGTVLDSIGHSWRNLELPLRMDTILGGVPIYNLTQFSALYPFYFAALPIFNGPIDVIYSMHWIVLFHLLVLEINTYVFLRVIGVSRLAALTGAALFAFSANSFTYASWINSTAPYSWFPLYLAGLVGILKFPGLKRYFVMALAGIVLLTLASPAQPLIHAVFVTVIFVCAYGISRYRAGRGSEIPRALGTVAAVGLLALLLTAPAILPALLEFKNMIRWIGPFPPVMGNSPIPFEAFQIDQLSIADLGGVFFKLKGPAVGNQFAGIIVVALAAVAAAAAAATTTATRLKTWIVAALVFIAVYALLSSAGANLGFAYLNYNIPILNKIREPSRFLVLFQFAVCALAALGIDELCRFVSRRENEGSGKPQWIALLVTPLLALISLAFIKERIVSDISPFVSLGVLLALVFLTWLAVKRFRFRWLDKWTALLWGGLALVVLTFEVPWLPPPVSSSHFLQFEGPSLDMALKRVAALDPGRNYRVLFDGKIDKQQAAMLASYHNVRTFNSYFNPAPKSQFEELYYHKARGDNYFRILGAKYLICRECDDSATNGYKLLETVAGNEIYETQDVLPHSYIANKTDGEFRDLADFATKAANFDLTKGLLFLPPGTNIGLASADDTAAAAVDSCIRSEEIRSSNHSRYVVQCKAPGVMVTNEFYDEAWTATVDGAKIKSLKVNGNQIGVPFAAGSHVIELRYLPASFVISIFLMTFGLALLIILLIRRF